MVAYPQLHTRYEPESSNGDPPDDMLLARATEKCQADRGSKPNVWVQNSWLDQLILPFLQVCIHSCCQTPQLVVGTLGHEKIQTV